jgi:photosynthetic reaction center cytochrome c subunit
MESRAECSPRARPRELLFLVIFLGIALATAWAQEGKVEELAEKVFKNIQVFKGIPASDLVAAMNVMAGSLGVSCAHCHVTSDKGRWPMEKDDKTAKQTARKMILMARQINENNFDGTNVVTCATCHQGHVKPVSIGPLADARPPTPPLETKGPAEDVDHILQAYLDALGGRAAMAAVKTRVSKGTIESEGKSYPVETFQSAPNRLLVTVQGSHGPQKDGFDGTVAWRSGFQGVFELKPGPEAEALKRSADWLGDLRIREQFADIAFKGREIIAGSETEVLNARTQGKIRELLFFDAKTHLLVRRLVLTATPVGELPEQTDYADYRPVGGVQVPYRIQDTGMDGVQVEKRVDVKQNVTLDDGIFHKPEAPSPPPPKP